MERPMREWDVFGKIDGSLEIKKNEFLAYQELREQRSQIFINEMPRQAGVQRHQPRNWWDAAGKWQALIFTCDSALSTGPA